MYLYIIFFSLAILSFLEVSHIRIKQYPHFYYIAYYGWVFLFFLLSSLRWENGTDWESYYLFFKSFNHITLVSYMEPGFTLMTSINATLFNYSTQLTCLAFISIIPIAWRYKSISPFPLFSLFIWYSTTFANIFPVRQSIAIALFVFSWKYIQEKRLKPFLFTILLGSMFHLTILITLPTYYLWHKRFSTFFFFYIIILLATVSIISDSILKNIMYTIGGDFLQNKLDYYLEANQESTFNSAYTSTQILFRGIINRTLYFFVPLILLRKYRKQDNYMNALFNIYFYGFCLFIMVTPLSPALGRLCTYTDMSQALLLPYIFQMKMNKYNIYLVMTIIILYFIIRFKGIVINYYDAYIPYKCVLFK